LRGKIGYQIFPDRFFNYGNTYENLLDWNEPVRSHENQEYDFYGGTLKGIEKKIDYLKKLDIDFLYLTPIFKANTNHRYDAVDFKKTDERLGSEEDLISLNNKLKNSSIELFLDIALNHTSKYSVLKENPDFYTGKNWADVENLPELNLENNTLKDYLFRNNDSVIKYYMARGINNWRLDCAYDLGYDFLKELKDELKKFNTKIIGEIWSYPKKWTEVTDGIMNYYYYGLIKNLLSGEISGNLFSEILEDTYKDCGTDIFKCWNMLSSHDTPRIKDVFGNLWKIALTLQFTLPGSPLIYYGEELGFSGNGDPFCRETMKWEKTKEKNEISDFYKILIHEFKNSEGLNSGDFIKLYSENKNIIAFERYSEKIRETRFVLINPTDRKTDCIIYTKNSSLMNYSKIKDVLSGTELEVFNSYIKASLPPNFSGIFKIKEEPEKYNFYKRIR